MDMQKAINIYEKMETRKLTGLKDDLIRAAIRYARIRTDWKTMTLEEKKQKDSERTFAHNAFIDACNILSRNMAKAEEDISWRRMMSDNRKEIGDFACFLHCILGIEAR